MIEQNNRQENEGLIVEAVDVAGIDVLEEDIAALTTAGGSCCGNQVANSSITTWAWPCQQARSQRSKVGAWMRT